MPHPNEDNVTGLSVAVAVADLDEAIELYRSAFGLPEPRVDTSDSDRVAVAVFDIGGSQLQLIAGTDDESMISQEVAAKGEGLHHFGLIVGSVSATLAGLTKAGIRTLGDGSRPGAFENQVAFVHPKAMRGSLVELIETA